MSRKNQRRRIAEAILATPSDRSVWKRLLIIASGLGGIFAAVLGGVKVYDRFTPHAPNVIVEHFWSYSPVLESHLKGDPPMLTWKVAFSITNLESKAVALVGLDPEFPPVEVSGHVLQINARGGSLKMGQVLQSEAELYERTVGREEWESAHLDNKDHYSPDPAPPFLIKPGEKQYFLFDLFLPVYQDGEICRYNSCIFEDQVVTPTILLGGHIDHSGKVWCVDKDVPFAIRLDDGRVMRRDLPSFVGVEGCNAPILEPPETPGGEPHFKPIPE
jgi:hypothetical protein